MLRISFMIISFGGLGNRRNLAPIKYSKNLDDKFLKASRNIDTIDLEVWFVVITAILSYSQT